MNDYIRTPPYEDIFVGMLTALEISEGIIKLTGDPGTGKTALCLALVDSLEKTGKKTVYFSEAPSSTDVMNEEILRSLHLELNGNFTRRLSAFLMPDNLPARDLVIIFDNAAAIDDETFMSIRMLNNIQNEKRGLVHIIIAGSGALDERLETPGMRAVTQHLDQSFVLRPINREELNDFCLLYLRNNGIVLDGIGKHMLGKIYRETGGMPGNVVDYLGSNTERFLELQNERESGDVESDTDAEDPVVEPATIRTNADGNKSMRFFMLAVVLIIITSVFVYLYWPDTVPVPQTASAPVIAEATAPIEVAESRIPDMEPAEETEDEITETGLTEEVASGLPVTDPLEEIASEIIETDLITEIENETADEVLAPEQQAENFVAAWLDSWQNKELEAYFAFYHEDYVPAYHESVDVWIMDRTQKITDPGNIEISFDRLEIIEEQDENLLLRFWMTYRTQGYSDETWKELRLRETDDAWQIEEERNLRINLLE